MSMRYLGGTHWVLKYIEIHEPKAGHLRRSQHEYDKGEPYLRTVGSQIKARSKVMTSTRHSSQPTTPSSPPSHFSATSSSSSNASLTSASFLRPPARLGLILFPITNSRRMVKYDFHNLNEAGK